MQQANLLIVGVGGFVGSHLTDRILGASGCTIHGWDISFDKLAKHLGNERLVLHRQYIDADTTVAELEPVIERVDAVVSLAAICTPATYVSSPVKTIRSNFIDAHRLVDLCAKYRKWLIHTSTCEVYGRTLSSYVPGEDYTNPDLYVQNEDRTPLVLGPVSNHRWSYAAAKQLFERYVLAHHREHGLPFTMVRPYNWFGPRMDFIPGRDGEGVPRVLACFMTALLDGHPMQLVDGGSAYRTITYIGDAVDALMAILEQPQRSQNQIFNIGNRGGEISIRDLAYLMRDVAAEITGCDEYRAHPIEVVPRAVFYGDGYEDCDRRLPDVRKAESLLGWEARTSLRDTLRITMEYYFATYAPSRLPRPAQVAAR